MVCRRLRQPRIAHSPCRPCLCLHHLGLLSGPKLGLSYLLKPQTPKAERFEFCVCVFFFVFFSLPIELRLEIWEVEKGVESGDGRMREGRVVSETKIKNESGSNQTVEI